VAVSEQTITSNQQGISLRDSSAHNNENSLTNYEISKTIQRVVEGSGNITRLSVAAVVNDIPKEVKNGEATEIVFEPRSPEQLRKLEEIVKNAVGVNATRNDQFSLVSIPFEVKPLEDISIEENISGLPNPDEWISLVFIVFAIVASLLVLKSLMKKLKTEKIVIGTFNPGDLAVAPSVPSFQPRVEASSPPPQINYPKKRQLPIGDIEDEISDEALMKKNQQDKIVNYVSKNPMDAAKLINAWMHEDEI
jgi:flagellar M-ring protein FliF